jgi:hypothetical protein
VSTAWVVYYGCCGRVADTRARLVGFRRVFNGEGKRGSQVLTTVAVDILLYFVIHGRSSKEPKTSPR